MTESALVLIPCSKEKRIMPALSVAQPGMRLQMMRDRLLQFIASDHSDFERLLRALLHFRELIPERVISDAVAQQLKGNIRQILFAEKRIELSPGVGIVQTLFGLKARQPQFNIDQLTTHRIRTPISVPHDNPATGLGHADHFRERLSRAKQMLKEPLAATRIKIIRVERE